MTDPNDPAFSSPDAIVDGPAGLTKREYFAAMAMNGVLAGIIYFANAKICGPGGVRESLSVAKLAVESADALIAELNKP